MENGSALNRPACTLTSNDTVKLNVDTSPGFAGWMKYAVAIIIIQYHCLSFYYDIKI